MIDELTNIITGWLNQNGTIDFKVGKDYNRFKKPKNPSQKQVAKPTVFGVLMPLFSKIEPLAEVKTYELQQDLSLLVPCDLNGDFLAEYQQVADIISAFIDERTGADGVFESGGKTYDYVFLANQYTVGGVVYEPFTAVPISIPVTWQVSVGGVYDRNITFTLDGETVNASRYNIARERVQESETINGSSEVLSIINQQGIVYTFEFPLTKSPLSRKLFKDMISGAVGQTYDFTMTADFGDEQITTTNKVVSTTLQATAMVGSRVTINGTFVLSLDNE